MGCQLQISLNKPSLDNSNEDTPNTIYDWWPIHYAKSHVNTIKFQSYVWGRLNQHILILGPLFWECPTLRYIQHLPCPKSFNLRMSHPKLLPYTYIIWSPLILNIFHFNLKFYHIPQPRPLILKMPCLQVYPMLTLS